MNFSYRSVSDSFSFWDISLWIVSIGISWTIAFYSFYKLITDPKDISDLQKKNAWSWAIAFFMTGVANILNLIWKYLIENELDARNLENISVCILNIAIFIKIFQTEYTINRYKFYKGYYFSIAMFIFIIFTITVTPALVKQIQILRVTYLLLLILGVSIFPGIFLYIALKLKAHERLMALRILMGSAFIAIGLMIQIQNIGNISADYITSAEILNAVTIIVLFLCPVLISIGTIIIFLSYKDAL